MQPGAKKLLPRRAEALGVACWLTHQCYQGVHSSTVSHIEAERLSTNNKLVSPPSPPLPSPQPRNTLLHPAPTRNYSSHGTIFFFPPKSCFPTFNQPCVATHTHTCLKSTCLLSDVDFAKSTKWLYKAQLPLYTLQNSPVLDEALAAELGFIYCSFHPPGSQKCFNKAGN